MFDKVIFFIIFVPITLFLEKFFHKLYIKWNKDLYWDMYKKNILEVFEDYIYDERWYDCD